MDTMIDTTIAAIVFTCFTAILIGFQLALAMGAPWGEMSMGGKYPGRYPHKMRVVAFALAVLWIIIALVVLTRAGITFENLYEYSKTGIWFVFGLLLVGAILNLITPSKKERILWTPIGVVMLISVYVIARSGSLS